VGSFLQYFERKLITPQALIAGIKEYSKTVDESLIQKAFVFALEHHGTQLRESGDPFFSHPLEVAEILMGLKMDQETVIAGILHDTVEDTSATIQNLEELFGARIAKIVDGVTKLSRFESSSISGKQAENFKKLLLAAASDIRILIIKLADRLHNMRTLKFKKKKEKRRAIARETLDVYASLAERIGITSIKDELQDIAFQELYPEIYSSLKSRLQTIYESSEQIINTITSELYKLAHEVSEDCSISGRVKSPYSIWTKMNVRNISFEQLSDIMAFRIIAASTQQCYQILGNIHKNYLVVPGRFRDYISAPKNNSYQSLHTCVIGPLNKRIEIQIRTKEMHEVAEYGIAAHWNYKEHGPKSNKDGEQQWLKNLVKILENTSGIEEFLEDSKTEILSDYIFCLTPKGLLISLPVGSTVLDFAFAIHSDVGIHAVSAKVNGNTVPMNTALTNGDQVDIATDPNHFPSPHWQDYVITIKAKTGLRKILNGFEKEKLKMIGKSMFDDFFKRINRTVTEEEMKFIIGDLKFDNANAMFQALSNGILHMKDVLLSYKKLGHNIELETLADSNETTSNKYVLPIVGIKEANLIPVTCCFPVPGDKIVGLRSNDGNGCMEIHIKECEEVSRKLLGDNTTLLELAWARSAFDDKNRYLTKLAVTTIYEPGNLSKIADIIESMGAGIANLKIGEKFEGFVRLQLEVEVQNVAQLTMIISKLNEASFVHEVSRRCIV
jgi:GTP pyrophosphokinase